MSIKTLRKEILLLGLIALLAMSQASEVSAGNNVWASIGPEGVSVVDLAIDPENGAVPQKLYQLDVCFV